MKNTSRYEFMIDVVQQFHIYTTETLFILRALRVLPQIFGAVLVEGQSEQDSLYLDQQPA